MGADLFECAGERFDVGVGEVLGEVSLDSVSVVAAGALQRLGAFVGEDDPEEDEWFYVLEGEITFWVADTRLSLKAGSFGFGPKGVPHTFYAAAGGARALVGFAPMQFEGFQREVGQPAPERVLPPPTKGHPDMAKLAPIAKRNGFEILAPPGPPPGH